MAKPLGAPMAMRGHVLSPRATLEDARVLGASAASSGASDPCHASLPSSSSSRPWPLVARSARTSRSSSRPVARRSSARRARWTASFASQLRVRRRSGLRVKKRLSCLVRASSTSRSAPPVTPQPWSSSSTSGECSVRSTWLMAPPALREQRGRPGLLTSTRARSGRLSFDRMALVHAARAASSKVHPRSSRDSRRALCRKAAARARVDTLLGPPKWKSRRQREATRTLCISAARSSARCVSVQLCAPLQHRSTRTEQPQADVLSGSRVRVLDLALAPADAAAADAAAAAGAAAGAVVAEGAAPVAAAAEADASGTRKDAARSAIAAASQPPPSGHALTPHQSAMVSREATSFPPWGTNQMQSVGRWDVGGGMPAVGCEG